MNQLERIRRVVFAVRQAEMAAIAGVELPSDLHLVRGVSYFEGIESPEIALLLKGSVIQDHGYFSSSVKREIASSFSGSPLKPPAPNVLFAVRAKKGQKAVPGTDYESEYIFPRGSKWRVLDVEVVNGGHTVHMLIEPA